MIAAGAQRHTSILARDRAQLRAPALTALAPASELCAVVKADGYGHGAVQCARAALACGRNLAGGRHGRRGRASCATPASRRRVLVMGALRDRTSCERAVELGADIVLWRERTLALASEAAARVSGQARVHVKLDTGMGRLGTRDPDEATRIVGGSRRRLRRCGWPGR